MCLVILIKLIKFFWGFSLFVLIYGCGFYSLPSGFYRTRVCVDEFKNHITILSPDLNFTITEKLKERINQQARLELVEKDGEIQIKGSIKDYEIRPSFIGSNQTAITNRVSLKVDIIFINLNDDGKTKNKEFNSFVDYGANQNFAMVKDSLNGILSTKIVDEIFFDLFEKW